MDHLKCMLSESLFSDSSHMLGMKLSDEFCTIRDSSIVVGVPEEKRGLVVL